MSIPENEPTLKGRLKVPPFKAFPGYEVEASVEIERGALKSLDEGEIVDGFSYVFRETRFGITTQRKVITGGEKGAKELEALRIRYDMAYQEASKDRAEE